MRKSAIIRKLRGGKYRLYSRKKGKDGKRKNLGTYTSRAGAEKRERQVQYFKHVADDGKDEDKQTRMLSDLSDIAKFLEEAGMVDKADKVYMVMELIDGSLAEDNIVDPYVGSDAEKNVENQGFIGGPSPVGSGYGGLSVDEAQRADDEQDNVDLAARSNGLRGITQIHDQNAGMFQGMSADPQFSGGISYRNLEGPYG